MKKPPIQPRFVICVCNDECDDLIVRKAYQVLPDASAAAHDCVRIIDESGEDYLYPKDMFVAVRLPHADEALLVGAHAREPELVGH